MKSKITILSILIIVFICLITGTVLLSYLARPVISQRENIVGFYAEPNNTLDMVYIGASTAYRFYSPLQAWNDEGYTSYVVAGRSTPLSTYESLIKEVRKSQDPEVILLDTFGVLVRNIEFEYYDYHLTQFTDSLKYSKVRNELIDNAIKYDFKDIDKSEKRKIKYDILKNYNNLRELDKSSFKYVLNNVPEPNKGFRMNAKHVILEQTSDEVINSDDYTELNDETKDILNDLIKYTKEENVEIIFITSPYFIYEDIMKVYRGLEYYLEGKNIKYLDLNKHYDEIKLDFSRDYYEINHTNVAGAEKVTEYLSRYISNNYEFSDKKVDTESWNKAYDVYSKKADKLNKKLNKKIN